jgi:hypothetical protein
MGPSSSDCIAPAFPCAAECKPSKALGVKEEASGFHPGASGLAAGVAGAAWATLSASLPAAANAKNGLLAGNCNGGQFPIAYGAYGEKNGAGSMGCGNAACETRGPDDDCTCGCWPDAF